MRKVRDIFPLTPIGLILLLGGLFALFYYGIHRLDLILLVIGAVISGCIVLGLLAVSLTAFFLWFAIRKQPREGGRVRLECGSKMMTGFSIRNLWFIPFVSVSWSWDKPQAEVLILKRFGRLHEMIIPKRRALSDTIRRRFEVSDIWGFCKVVFHTKQERIIHFVPSVGRLKNVDVVRSMAGGDDLSHPDGPPVGERIDIRSYQTGDPIRYILWKVFARTRQIVVRTQERAIGPVRQTVAYLVSGKGDEPAAGAVRVAVEAGCLGDDWVLGADGEPEPLRTKPAAFAAISRSSDVEEKEQGAGLKTFLHQAIPGIQAARALVFVPAVKGPWIDRVTLSSNVRPGMIEYVVCTDGIVKSGMISGFGRLLRHSGEPKDPSAILPTALHELKEVLATLSTTRCNVMVIDRQTGQVFGHIEKLIRSAS